MIHFEKSNEITELDDKTKDYIKASEEYNKLLDAEVQQILEDMDEEETVINKDN